ncbi:GIY-YIG nuclease family protein [Mycolicibacterium aichiense]|uniref:GIY-YIG nuclease family protein n=2 Tax=Mycolicibacterium TaxID=1866885 RepID=UPI001E375421|nr:hypothetical protein [Mycolicibacterium aichiense]
MSISARLIDAFVQYRSVPTPDDVARYLAANIHSRAEVMAKPPLVEQVAGVYGWWFRELPGDIDVAHCEVRDARTLLYAGISPKAPPKNGQNASRQSLRKRIRTHYSGNAARSTLRLTLGCLLAEHLGIELRRYGSSERLHFGAGEQDLSRWMAANAFVSWYPTPQPWLLEDHLLETQDLPLNLDKNNRNPFHSQLSDARAAAKARARSLPVLRNPGIGGAHVSDNGVA